MAKVAGFKEQKKIFFRQFSPKCKWSFKVHLHVRFPESKNFLYALA